MTSKEMEARSGVPRANIRYYEAEGLLTPARAKNGYREYSEEDLALLEKIKLLRRLGVGVEELKALRAGSASLPDVLDHRLAELGGQRDTLARVEQVCGNLRQAGETFDTLDAGQYLAALDAPALPQPGEGAWWKAPAVPPLPESDALPICTSIPRRLFARLFDELLTSMLLIAALALAGHNPALVNNTLLGLAVQLVILFVEPLLIHLSGTTPGKALLGLRLEGPGGEKLTYAEGFTRHLLMLWGGVGLGIPIWSWIQMFRSAKRCMDGEPQPWDVDVAYETRPFRLRRLAAIAAAAGLILLAGETANAWSQLPPNRGELTVAEFAENFNRQADYMDMDFSGQRLDETGTWEDRPYDGALYLTAFSDWGTGKNVPFAYTVEDGRLTKLTLSAEMRNTEEWLSLPTGEMAVAAASFAWARKDAPFWPKERRALLAALDGGEPFALRHGDAVVSLDIDQEGFRNTDMGFMIPEEGREENRIAFTFTITLEE